MTKATKEMVQLWGRLGITVNATEEDIKDLRNNEQETLIRLIKEGKVVIDGETYFPVEDYNEPLYKDNNEEVGFNSSGIHTLEIK